MHCGHGPLRGAHTGLEVFARVLDRHPRLVTVLAHAGDAAVRRRPRAGRAGTTTSTWTRRWSASPFTERFSPLPADWPARLADVGDRVVLGTDFPNIPYDYATQLRAIAGWAAADDRLGVPFLRRVLHDTPARLLGVS